jgi:hypothetical protein
MKTNDTETQVINSAVISHLLATWLGEDEGTIEEGRFDAWGLTTFEVSGETYAVGTDEECDAACFEYIKDSVWAFNATFILSQCGLPLELVEAIQSFQQKECESANNALLALIEKTCGLPKFVRTAIGLDGRGHFLASHDGDEISLGNGFFAYRIG